MGVDDAEAMTGLSRWTWRKYAYEGRVCPSLGHTRHFTAPNSNFHSFLWRDTQLQAEQECLVALVGLEVALEMAVA
jgi:hypothetical protein